MTVLIITLLIILNGIFVAAEFAIIGAPRIAIARLAEQGNKSAQIVHAILSDPEAQDRYVATAQLGITFASLGLGMYGEHQVAEWIIHSVGETTLAELISIHAFASVVAVTILTYLHIVLGEMIPKTLALQGAMKTALFISRPMVWVKRGMLPLVLLLNGIGNLILKLIGLGPEAQAKGSQTHSIEELQFIIRESREVGLLKEQSGEVIEELLEFSDLTAKEVMVPRVMVNAIPIDASPATMREILARTTHTRYPVHEHDLDHVRGVAHIKDVLRALRHDEPLSSKYVHEPPFVPETAPLNDVLKAMIQARTQMVVVMDEHGGTEGIVSLEDLFEEVIGQIEETATRRPPISEDAIGRLIVEGTVRLEEIGEELGIDLEHDE
ncbi:MAG: hemolysin family protein, partial [Thermoanaerobaculia bacterium]|nr:hemolysin family protein [Thermoanaerobaculia bacterium]